MTYGGTSNRGPSVAELQRFIREASVVVFMLSNGETVTGILKWADENAFQILPEGRPPVTILRAAVLGYHRPAESSGGGGSSQKQSAKAAVSAGDGKHVSDGPGQAADAAGENAQDDKGGS